nr:TonB-dependent receptor [Prevotella sp. KH2C16]
MLLVVFLADAQITIKVQNKTIQQVLRQIERETGYSIFYSDKLAGLNQKTTLSVSNENIEKVLNHLLVDTEISYRIESGKQIILTQKSRKEIAAPVKQKKLIKGIITDPKGDPLIGVSISIDGTNSGTISDVNGQYQIDAPSGSLIRYSYVGFQGKTLRVGNAETYNIVLTEDDTLLEEVVVVGYGSMKRKDITTAVSVVSTKDLDERPLMSVVQAVQGKAAGIQVVQPSGAPGTGLSVRVRGATSVQASNEPLYVVDGMPTDNISDISPNDIETMQILKDASSAAIYGARAANGVVLITTKRGAVGTPRVKFSAYAGFSVLGRKLDALNTEEYKDLMADLKKVSNVAPSIPDTEHRYTDWTDLFFKTGIEQNYQLSFQNGSERLQYFISGGYTDQGGIVEKSNFKRYNFRANIDSKQTKWLDLALNFSYAHTNGRWVRESSSSMRSGSILSVINTPPFMQKWSPDNENWYDEQAYGSRILNPLAANAADNETGTDYVKGSFGVTVHLAKGLNWKTTFGLDLNNERWNYYLDPVSTSDGRSTKGRVEESSSRNVEWLLENILTYEASFGKHNLSLMSGATQQHAQYKGSWMAGFDLSEAYPEIHSIAAANQIDKDATGAGASAWSLASFLGRIAYNYDSKYLLTMNFRADGSSRFAKGHRWGYFPSVSAGWRLSSEPFMESWRSVVDDMKLRIGWGMNGNQGGIGNYSYLAGMSASKVAPTAANLYPGLAITANTAANKELTWEKTAQWNAGLDVILWNGRLNFSVDAYYKKTTDLLLTVSLPDNVNLPGGITRNDGEMVNKGFEFNFSSDNLKGEFRWNTDFNISFNKNKLTKLGLNKVYYYGEMYETKEPVIVLREGLSLGSFFGYISEGVDPETGDIKYADLNPNGITDPGDRTVIGNAQPDFIYGLTNTFSYKGFSLSLFLQGSQGNDIYNATRIDTEGMMDFRNQSKNVLDRWRRPGMITEIPRAGNVENIHNSSRFVEDGSYLRLKTATLAYLFDKEQIRKWGLSRLQLYVTGQNLLTLTKYSGYDPEVNAYGSNAVLLGIDYGTYPQSKAVIFGLNIEF